jgi:hypothetical protein
MDRVRAKALSAWLMILVLVVSATGCGATSTPAPTITAALTSAPSASTTQRAGVVGLIAIGHSALTGENSDPKQPGAEVHENSWATGTNPAVDSIYQRMIDVRSETAGHVANLAEAGAPASRLGSQAREALSQVPTPALAIVQTIDNDIRCDGTDASHVAEFGAQVADALKVISDASPHTRILIITQPGRPAAELKEMGTLIASNPLVKKNYTGPPPCGAFDPTSGKPVPKDVANLTAIIEAYEAEQARVCARFPLCRTDGGRLSTFAHAPSVVSSDYNHLNVTGLAKFAALVWPFANSALQDATPAP